MELSLNLAWLLLALPALWLWRASATTSFRRKFGALQCLLALACTLAVLFPVISASDDLLVMRSEAEEAPVGKRMTRPASHEKSSASKWLNSPALVAAATNFFLPGQFSQPSPNPHLMVPAAPAVQRPARAPPLTIIT